MWWAVGDTLLRAPERLGPPLVDHPNNVGQIPVFLTGILIWKIAHSSFKILLLEALPSREDPYLHR